MLVCIYYICFFIEEGTTFQIRELLSLKLPFSSPPPLSPLLLLFLLLLVLLLLLPPDCSFYSPTGAITNSPNLQPKPLHKYIWHRRGLLPSITCILPTILSFCRLYVIYPGFSFTKRCTTIKSTDGFLATFCVA